MIALCTITAIIVIAIPMMSLSVLFDEIATELSLSLVQVGIIWGISSFTGMFVGLLGGILADRFGTRVILTLACLGVGIFGASRGLATNFTGFIVSSFLLGLFGPVIGVNMHTVAGQWFSPKQLGLANGLISSGFATGFLLGSMFAARILSPMLGSWQAVFYLYGGVAVVIAGVWWVVHPPESAENPDTPTRMPLREGLPRVLRIRPVLLIGLGKLGIWGCVRGFTGYLPLYLRGIGWEPNAADTALSLFFVVSLLGAIPIPMLSDRIGIRKPFLIAAAFLVGGGTLLTGFVTTSLVFFTAMLAGVMFDAFMGLTTTTISELKNVRGSLVGTALGAAFFFSDLGGTIAPPLGNALAEISAELPFFLWGGMAILGSLAFAAIKETK